MRFGSKWNQNQFPGSVKLTGCTAAPCEANNESGDWVLKTGFVLEMGIKAGCSAGIEFKFAGAAMVSGLLACAV